MSKPLQWSHVTEATLLGTQKDAGASARHTLRRLLAALTAGKACKGHRCDNATTVTQRTTQQVCTRQQWSGWWLSSQPGEDQTMYRTWLWKPGMCASTPQGVYSWGGGGWVRRKGQRASVQGRGQQREPGSIWDNWSNKCIRDTGI